MSTLIYMIMNVCFCNRTKKSIIKLQSYMWFPLCRYKISRIRITGIKLNDKFDYTVKPCAFWNQPSFMKNGFLKKCKNSAVYKKSFITFTKLALYFYSEKYAHHSWEKEIITYFQDWCVLLCGCYDFVSFLPSPCFIQWWLASVASI